MKFKMADNKMCIIIINVKIDALEKSSSTRSVVVAQFVTNTHSPTQPPLTTANGQMVIAALVFRNFCHFARIDCIAIWVLGAMSQFSVFHLSKQNELQIL